MTVLKKRLTKKVGELLPHPNQPRSEVDLEALGELVAKIYATEGLRDDKPILVAERDDKTFIVDGHRRYVAYLLYLRLQEILEVEKVDPLDDAQGIAEWVFDYLSEADFQSAVYDLATAFEQTELEVAVFRGTYEEELLEVMQANYGRLANDTLGEAEAFYKSVTSAELTASQIASQIGKSVPYVSSRIAVGEILERYPKFLEKVGMQSGFLGMCSDLIRIKDEAYLDAMVHIIIQEGAYRTSNVLKGAVDSLNKFEGLSQPTLLVEDTTTRNKAYIFSQLWQEKMGEDADEAEKDRIINDLVYAALFGVQGQSGRRLCPPPGFGHDYYNETMGWFYWANILAPGYVGDGHIAWRALARQYLKDLVVCKNCPLFELGEPFLNVELPYPCRTTERDENDVCIDGWLPDEEPIVTANRYVAHIAPRVLSDMESQARFRGSGYVLETMDTIREHRDAVVKSYELRSEDDGDLSAPPDAEPEKDEGAKATLLATYEQYMQTHEDHKGASHPLATLCRNCEHYQGGDKPPEERVADDCAWTDRLRSYYFWMIRSDEDSSFAVPWCRQFQPTAPLSELVPPYPNQLTMNRDQLRSYVRDLLDRISSDVDRGMPLEQFTGRPFTKSEYYGDWLKKRYEQEAGNMTTEQLFHFLQLLWWAWNRSKGWIMESRKGDSEHYYLPLIDGASAGLFRVNSYFVPLSELEVEKQLAKNVEAQKEREEEGVLAG